MWLEADALQQLLGHRQAFAQRITHFCAVWDPEDNTYVFVASTASDEDAWTIRPGSRSNELTEAAPPAWDHRRWMR